MGVDTAVRTLYWVLLKIRLVLAKIVPVHEKQLLASVTEVEFPISVLPQQWHKHAVVMDTMHVLSLTGCSVVLVVCLYRFMLL